MVSRCLIIPVSPPFSSCSAVCFTMLSLSARTLWSPLRGWISGLASRVGGRDGGGRIGRLMKCVGLCACACACACACVCERERERERAKVLLCVCVVFLVPSVCLCAFAFCSRARSNAVLNESARRVNNRSKAREAAHSPTTCHAQQLSDSPYSACESYISPGSLPTAAWGRGAA